MLSLRYFFILPLFAIVLSNNQISAAETEKSAEDRPLRKLEWIGLLQRSEFDVLTSRLEHLQERHEKGEISSNPVQRAFGAFKYTDPTLLKQFDAWVEKHPRSFAAFTARGTFLAHLGYTARGSWSAGNTSGKAFATMGNFLAAAVKDFFFASKLNRRAIIPYTELIGAYRVAGPGIGADNTYKVAKDLVPDASLLHEEYTYALLPKWRGGRTREEYKNNSRAFTKFATEVVQKSKTDATYLRAARSIRNLALRRETGRRNFQAALEGYTELIKMDDSAYFHSARGSVLLYMDRDEDALKDARRAIEIDPDYGHAYRLAGEVLKHMKRYGEAAKFYDEAVKLDPLNADILLEKVKVLWQEERWKEIEQALEKALAFGQWNSEVHGVRGALYSNMRLYKEAKAAYRRALDLSPRDTKLLVAFTAALVQDEDCEAFEVLPTLMELCAAGARCSKTMLGIIKYNIESMKLEKMCRRKAPWTVEKAPLDRAF